MFFWRGGISWVGLGFTGFLLGFVRLFFVIGGNFSWNSLETKAMEEGKNERKEKTKRKKEEEEEEEKGVDRRTRNWLGKFISFLMI